jgi:hypothetical protein
LPSWRPAGMLRSVVIISNLFLQIEPPTKIQPTYQEEIQQYPTGSLNPITEFGDKVIYSKRFNRPIKIKKTKPNHDLIPPDLKPNVTETVNKTIPEPPVVENNQNKTSDNITVNATVPNPTPQ